MLSNCVRWQDATTAARLSLTQRESLQPLCLAICVCLICDLINMTCSVKACKEKRNTTSTC